MQDTISNNANGYVKDWNWNQKIRYVLTKRGKLSRKGIIDAIIELEPELLSEKRKIGNSIGATLAMSKDKENVGYGREETDNGFIYFALKS